MSIDELYAKPRDMQQAFPGMGEKDEAIIKYAVHWIATNPGAWAFMVNVAKMDAAEGRRVSMKFLLEYMRHELHVSVRNAAAPIFARIMATTNQELAEAFRMNQAGCDAWLYEAVV